MNFSTVFFALSFSGLAAAAPAPLPAEIHKPKPLNCEDPQTIRDFKDFIISYIGLERKWADRDARCACGDVGDAAGRNYEEPQPPTASPGFPAFNRKDPDGSMKKAKDFYLKYFPVNEEQATKLADCSYGEIYRKVMLQRAATEASSAQSAPPATPQTPPR